MKTNPAVAASEADYAESNQHKYLQQNIYNNGKDVIEIPKNVLKAVFNAKTNPAVTASDADYAQPRSNFSSPGGALNPSEVIQLIRTKVTRTLGKAMNRNYRGDNEFSSCTEELPQEGFFNWTLIQPSIQ